MLVDMHVNSTHFTCSCYYNLNTLNNKNMNQKFDTATTRRFHDNLSREGGTRERERER